MILQNFDITLRQMCEEDLEMVLLWRNSEHIRQYALTQETITLQEHKAWFDSLAKKGDLYFIIESDKKPVGLIWANRFQEKSCETGMYIYETKLQNSLFAYKVSLTLNEYLFQVRKLEAIECEILNENKRSIRYTLSLGYEESHKEKEVTYFKLTKERFEPNFEKISKRLKKSTLR